MHLVATAHRPLLVSRPTSLPRLLCFDTNDGHEDCDDNGAINQVYYYYNVRGSVQTGDFVAADVDGGSKSVS